MGTLLYKLTIIKPTKEQLERYLDGFPLDENIMVFTENDPLQGIDSLFELFQEEVVEAERDGSIWDLIFTKSETISADGASKKFINEAKKKTDIILDNDSLEFIKSFIRSKKESSLSQIPALKSNEFLLLI